jgi:hypothetical protein
MKSLGKVEVDGETPKVCDPSPEELGRTFQTLLEKHLYSANMKHVIQEFNLDAL